MKAIKGKENELVLKAIKTGKIFLTDPNKKEQFNRGCDHISCLIRDACLIYKSNSFASALFLAITAIEEIAKIEISLHRNKNNTTAAIRRNDDILFNHKAKHSIALQAGWQG